MAKHVTRTKLRPVHPELPRTRFVRQAVIAAPAPTPQAPPRPRGELDSAPIEQIRTVAAQVWPLPASRCASRNRGLRRLGEHLAALPGATWQQRWEASGLNGRHRPVRDLDDSGTPGRRTELTHAAEALFCLRIVQPSLEAFRANQFVDYPEVFRTAQADPALDAFFAAVAKADTSRHYKRRALFDVCCALTTQGIALADLTPEAFLHYARTTRGLALSAYSYATYVGHLAWQILHEIGHFPRSVPSTLRAALRAPQMSPTELVDQYRMRNAKVRQLLVDYLERRGHDLDYSSLSGLATLLVRNFWVAIEGINPSQADLRLSEETYQQWRAAIRYREDGKPRLGQDQVLTAVRALYFDIQAWAAHEPERWAVWAAPCPIPNREMRASSQQRRRTRERIADRIRSRQPLLPALVEHVETTHRHLAELLAAASAAKPDQVLAVDSRLYRRLFTPGDQRRVRLHGQANVRVRDEASGHITNVTAAEDTAFWSWAVVETLRHTGCRIEELLELSQLSIRQYQRPNGEVIALLVIAPSKTDRERVIPMSAELFHVIACILRRLTSDRRTVPLATRYDIFERITSDPQPFLFQRRIGQRNEVMTPGAVGEMLRRVGAKLAQQRPEFAEHRFTPHDFRRLFATDLVNHGLPIHIGAALLGHLNLETTRGYIAVFEEDVVRHYQAHLARRRQLRPQTEYRPATPAEWQELEEHFDKRKLDSATAAAPTPHPAPTNTPAAAAPCCASTRRCLAGSTRSKPTCSPVATAPKPKAGSARSRAST